MTAKEIRNLIENTLENLPDRMSGNEANCFVLDKLKKMVITDRESIVEALRSYLKFRTDSGHRCVNDAIPESRIWMALEIAEGLSLIELRSEIEILITEIHHGKVFLPVHVKSVEKYLQCLERANQKH